jgi:hypothetical protein
LRTNRFGRIALVAFTLLVFAFQTYVTQTHIHLAPDAFGATTTLHAQKLPPDKFPARDDPANCPICQEILHAGQFITPQAAAVLLPSVVVSVIAIVIPIAATSGIASHAWQSRGPPRP